MMIEPPVKKWQNQEKHYEYEPFYKGYDIYHIMLL